jgi:hypothetical protein
VSSGSLTVLIILVTLIHVAAFAVMIVIRVRRNEVDGTTGGNALITPCAVCGEPATHRSYDGLDPNERRDPHTGRSYSTDMSYYQPLCGAHTSAIQPSAAARQRESDLQDRALTRRAVEPDPAAESFGAVLEAD